MTHAFGLSQICNGTVAILHRLRAEVHFFVCVQMAIVRAQVFLRPAP
jgi:hypothetical protein